MMAVYGHVRRKALDEAAKALEPEIGSEPLKPDLPDPTIADGELPSATAHVHEDSRVTSQVTSQQAPSRDNVIDFPNVLPER